MHPCSPGHAPESSQASGGILCPSLSDQGTCGCLALRPHLPLMGLCCGFSPVEGEDSDKGCRGKILQSCIPESLEQTPCIVPAAVSLPRQGGLSGVRAREPPGTAWVSRQGPRQVQVRAPQVGLPRGLRETAGTLRGVCSYVQVSSVHSECPGPCQDQHRER